MNDGMDKEETLVLERQRSATGLTPIVTPREGAANCDRTDCEFIELSYSKNGRRGGDRTHNPRLRRPVLYPIELLAHAFSL